MGKYLNPDGRSFEENSQRRLFIDKTALLPLLNRRIRETGKFVCVTMPSRFGKTFLASMIKAYYTKGDERSKTFDGLNVSKDPSYREHLNKHNVLYLDIANLCDDSGGVDVKAYVSQKAGRELIRSYPDYGLSADMTFSEMIAEIFEKSGGNERFIVVIDEWDYLLRNYPDNAELFDGYIQFLKTLFKNESVKPAIELAYMTGIMPIKRYGSMSALNEFEEFTMVSPDELAPFFGFCEKEVKTVMSQSGTKLSLDELKEWYDGYRLPNVGEVYCPNSVCLACNKNLCRDYFAGTMAVTSIQMGLKNDFISLSKETATLLSGGSVTVKPGDFSSDLSRLDTANKGLVALVHAGFLRFDAETRSASIPNKEVALRFEDAVGGLGLPGVSDLIRLSDEVVKATLRGDAAAVEKAFDACHLEFVSVFAKADENVLAVLCHVLYCDIRKTHVPLLEPCLGKGRADAVFLPALRSNNPALVVELKVDGSSDSAIEQIKDKGYFKPLENYYGEIVLVGIDFNRESMKHSCRIERIKK